MIEDTGRPQDVYCNAWHPKPDHLRHDVLLTDFLLCYPESEIVRGPRVNKKILPDAQMTLDGSLFFEDLLLVAAASAAVYGLYLVNAFWFDELLEPSALLANAAVLAALGLAVGAVLWLALRAPAWAGGAVLTATLLVLGTALLGALRQSEAVSGAQRATPAPASRPNVLLIMVDTLRADHLGVYGYERPTSPAIDSLAAEGVLFRRCLAASSWTRPSTVSVLSGVFPFVHRQHQQIAVIPADTDMIPGPMREHGYRTAFISTNVVVNRAAGFARGVDLYRAEKTLLCLTTQRVTRGGYATTVFL